MCPVQLDSRALHPPNLLTYSFSRVLLKKLTGFQLVKKFPAFNGTRMFITAFTSARHLSLSCVSLIQSTPPHSTSWRSILILSSCLRLGLPSSLFPPDTCRNSCPKYCRSYGSCRHSVQDFAGIKSGTSVTCQMHVMASAAESMRHRWQTGVVQWSESVRLLYPLAQRFSNFFQVGTIFISQNVLRTTLLLNVLSIC